MDGHPLAGLPGGIPLDRASGRTIVTDWRLIPLSGIDVLPNGLNVGEAQAHLRIVNVPAAKAWLCPLTRKALQTLIEQAQDVLDGLPGAVESQSHQS